MINLIPNQEKKKKVKDFYFRLTVVFFAIMGCCFIVASVAILPSYFLSSVKKNLVLSKLESQQNETVPLVDQNTLATADELNKKLTLIENAGKDKYLVSEKVINEIVSKKMSDIKIVQFSYESTVAGKEISIRGVAPSRDRLLSFRRALEDSGSFEKVDLPISNFVKGSNIQFYLSLIPS